MASLSSMVPIKWMYFLIVINGANSGSQHEQRLWSLGFIPTIISSSFVYFKGKNANWCTFSNLAGAQKLVWPLSITYISECFYLSGEVWSEPSKILNDRCLPLRLQCRSSGIMLNPFRDSLQGYSDLIDSLRFLDIFNMLQWRLARLICWANSNLNYLYSIKR